MIEMTTIKTERICRAALRHARLLPGIAGLAFWILTCPAGAGDWPQFLGPKGDATSPEKGLIRAWPAGGPKVVWNVPVGAGYGGAAIREGSVYILDRVERQKDVLRVLDLATGKETWSYSYDAPGEISHEGSRSTPAVTSQHVFTIGPFGQLHCLDRSTHQVVWKKNLVTDYGAKAPRWAVAQSPIVYQDLLIVAPQADQAGIVALEQASGKERWRSGPIGPMAYGSGVAPSPSKGVEQFVIVNSLGAAAVSAADGKVLWKYAHACKIPIPNVTALGGGKLFVTGAYMAGSAIIQVSRQNDLWSAKELSRHPQIGGHCHPALFYQEHLYLLANVNERTDGLVCFDTECKVVWQTKNSPSFDKGGSILTADGLIYLLDGRTGELHIVAPSPAGFKSLDKSKVLDGREIWGPLALADGRLGAARPNYDEMPGPAPLTAHLQRVAAQRIIG